MPKTRELSIETRSAIAAEYNLGISAEELAKKYKCHKNTIWYQVRKQNICGTVQNIGVRQRPRITNARENAYITRCMLTNAHLSQRGLAKTLKDNKKLQIHHSTISRRLKEAGVKAYTCTKKFYISKQNKIKRLLFAKQHMNKPPEFWRNVLFTDESSVSLDGSWGRKFYYSEPEKVNKRRVYATQRQGGGGNLMVWGCITNLGVGPLAMVSGKMNQMTYLELLNDVALVAGSKIIGLDFILQHDNAPAHKAFVVTKFLNDLDQQRINWPPQSPDLNIIENVWAYVKRNIPYRVGRSKQELWDEIVEVWSKIPLEFISKLFDSIPRRLNEVILNNGGQTKY